MPYPDFHKQGYFLAWRKGQKSNFIDYDVYWQVSHQLKLECSPCFYWLIPNFFPKGSNLGQTHDCSTKHCNCHTVSSVLTSCKSKPQIQFSEVNAPQTAMLLSIFYVHILIYYCYHYTYYYLSWLFICIYPYLSGYLIFLYLVFIPVFSSFFIVILFSFY